MALQDNELAKIAFENFMKGQITRVPSERCPIDAFSDAQNVSLNEKFLPIIALGQYKYNATTLGAYPVRGGCVYKTTAGTKYYVVACGGKIFYSTVGSGTFTAYQVTLNSAAVDMTVNEDTDFEFAQYNGRLYIVNGKYPIITNDHSSDHQYTASRLIKITDTTPVGLTVSDIPSGLKYIWVDKERLFGLNSIAQPSGLFWTNAYFDYSTNSEANWTPTSGLNYDYVGKDDGESGAGIFPYQNSMFVFKDRNIYRYSTDGDITNWGSVRLDTTRGCPFNRTIQLLDGYLYWLSFEGIVRSDGTNVELIDDNIRDKIFGLPQMSSNSRQWNIATTTDFAAGTYGTTLIDTADNELKQLAQTSQTDWEAGTSTDVDTAVIPGSVLIHYFSGTQSDYWLTSRQTLAAPGNTYCSYNMGSGSAYYVNKILVSTAIQNLYYDGSRVFSVYTSLDNVTWTYRGQVNGAQTDYPVTINAAVKYIKVSVGLTVFATYVDSIKPYQYYLSTGNIVTRTLDYGLTPVSFGNVAAEITTPSYTSITFQSRSSANGTDWSAFANIGTAGENGGAINSAVARYLQIKAILVTTNYLYTPTLSAIYVGGTWQSAITNLGVTPAAWGNFDTTYVLNAQTLTWWMRSAATSGGIAAATWYQQTPGAPVVSVTLNQYVQVQIRFNTTLATQIPIMQSFRVTWYTGANIVKPCSYIYNKEYCLNIADFGQTVNNIVWRYTTYQRSETIQNIFGYFVKRTNRGNNVYFIDEGIILAGTSASDGFVRKIEIGSTDDATAIDAWFITKNVNQDGRNNIFRSYKLIYRSDQTWTLSYSTDNGATWTDLTIPASSATRELVKTIPGLVLGRFLMVKCRQVLEDTNWAIELVEFQLDLGFEASDD